MTRFLELMNFDVAFSNFHINSYFVFVSTGLIVGCLILVYRSKELKKYRQDLFFCFLYAFIGIIIGAKLFYILTILKYLILNPSLWLHILEGGLSFYGGVIGGLIGALIYIRQYDIPMWSFLDSAAVAIPIGHAIGRLGCLVQGCCHGIKTDCIFGIIYPQSNAIAPSSIMIHPVQLYESCANLIIFFVLLFVSHRTKTKGLLLGLYMVLYGIVRFALEYLRADFTVKIFIFSIPQFISILMIIFGVVLVYGKYNQRIETLISGKNKDDE